MDYRPPRPDQPYAWDDERLSAYLDGELSAPEQAQLEARLVVDPELRQLVDELRAVRQQLEILPEYRLQSTFAEQVLRRAEQEMLLSPLDRETPAVPLNAATAAMPDVSASNAESLTTPLPSRFSTRFWRRGAIWTAVAAAAVLLLIVTNQPHDPLQDQLARQELPEGVTVATGAAKSGAAAKESSAAQATDKQQPAQNETAIKRMEDEALGRPEEKLDGQIPQRKQAVFADSAPGDAGPVNNSPPTPPKLADSAVAPGIPLLKNQAPAQSLAIQEQQSARLHQPLPTELAALLASEDFSRLASARDERKSIATTEEQVLVVYVTPRSERQGNRKFESLLASNSIELADKSLAQPKPANRQRTLPPPTPILDRTLAEPRGKASDDKTQAAESKDRKSMDFREDGKSEDAGKAAVMKKEKSNAPASESPEEHDEVAANELYYLEADANQVDELLRQLRAAPDQYSNLSVASRELPEYENRMSFHAEKNLESQSSAAMKAERKTVESERVADAAPAGNEPRVQQLLGDQKSGPAQQSGTAQQFGTTQQFAQSAPLATPAGAESAGAPAPPPAPAAEPATMPAATVASDATPQTVSPLVPGPTAAAPASAAKLSDAPMAEAGVDLSNAGLRGAAPSTEGQENLGNADYASPRNDAAIDRRETQAEKSLPKAASDRVIAYRLRGVESFKFAKNPEATDSFQGAGGGFGSVGAKADELSLQAKTSAAERSGANDKPKAEVKPYAKNGVQKTDGATREQAANDADAALPAMSQADSKRVVPQPEAKSEKKSDPQAKAESSSDTDPMSAVGEAKQRFLSRDKNLEPSDNFIPAEATKKSTPMTSKRVRVLFVIEHESTKE